MIKKTALRAVRFIAPLLIVVALFAGGNLIFKGLGTLGLSSAPLRIVLTVALLVVVGVVTIVAIFAWMLSRDRRAGRVGF